MKTAHIDHAPLYGYDPVTNSIHIESGGVIERDEMRGWAAIAKRSFKKWLADEDEK